MRFRPILLAAALVTLAAAPAARAQGYYPPQRYGPRDSGLYLGGRIGLGFPTGDLAGALANGTSTAMSDTVGAKVPFTFEFGVRANRVIRIGAFLQLAPVGVKDAVCGQSSCSGSDTELGAALEFHLAPAYRALDPWIGVGVGYEWLTNNGVLLADGFPGDQTWRGWFFPIQAGLDFPVAPQFTIGPYFALDLGTFGRYSDTITPAYEIGSTSQHQWISIGVRGTFLL